MKISKKQNFTLVEVMIALSISAIVMAMIFTVVLNLYSIARDGAIDYKMTEYGYLIRQKVLRSYGLRQAFYDAEMNVSETSMSFNVVSSEEDWPDTTPTEKTTTLALNESGDEISVTTALNSDQELSMMGIKVLGVKMGQRTTSLGVKKTYMRVLFKKTQNDKSYVREELIEAPALFE